MNNLSLIKLFRTSFNNLKVVAPEHNPFKGHLACDEPTKSRFSFSHAENMIGTLADLLGKAEMIEVNEGTGAILFVFKSNREVGETVTNTPIPSNSYTMQMIHGMLQPVGEGQLTRSSTEEFTVCLTWEDIPGQGKDLALASVYPGRPDAPWYMGGLDEGQTITGQQLLDRGCFRVC